MLKDPILLESSLLISILSKSFELLAGMMMMMMMMSSPVGTTYELRSHSTSCDYSNDRQGRFWRVYSTV